MSAATSIDPAELRRMAWSGSHPGDHLYGLRPLRADLAFKLLMLAAQIEADRG